MLTILYQTDHYWIPEQEVPQQQLPPQFAAVVAGQLQTITAASS